jgi:hypothetical protein
VVVMVMVMVTVVVMVMVMVTVTHLVCCLSHLLQAMVMGAVRLCYCCCRLKVTVTGGGRLCCFLRVMVKGKARVCCCCCLL